RGRREPVPVSLPRRRAGAARRLGVPPRRRARPARAALGPRVAARRRARGGDAGAKRGGRAARRARARRRRARPRLAGPEPGAVGLLCGLAVARRRSGARRIPFAAWAGLAAGAGVAAEAVLLNPVWLEGSEPFLAAVGAPALAVAVASLAAALPGRASVGGAA